MNHGVPIQLLNEMRRVGVLFLEECPMTEKIRANGKAFSNMDVGYNNVDVNVATKYGVAVGNTPVKLCGHATLAVAHCLFTSDLVNADKIEFLTLSGVLIAKRVPEAQKNGKLEDCYLIELDFPVVPLTEFDSAKVPSISKALSGASVIELKKTTTGEDLFVVLPSGKAVADHQPKFDEIQRCPGRRLIITALAKEKDLGLTFLAASSVQNWGSMR
ncbi:Glycerate dehydrogenase [Camellia lanceoleosa]|uniref:Glycerate dehydrogenase n=1 Tax=Camellia lanceoleosa TaxID=1840588 RepID=A0ACC0GN13_9ERIC|nr:Glycerate dehydrogenase [Camellia lanceoleosa]